MVILTLCYVIMMVLTLHTNSHDLHDLWLFPHRPTLEKEYNRSVKLNAICVRAEKDGIEKIMLSVDDAYLIGLDLEG